MSRIGKKPITIPKGTTVELETNAISVKGALGELNWNYPAGIILEYKEDTLVVQRSTNLKRDRALHGLARSLIYNMVVGVTEGYTRNLTLIGVGYRAQVNKSDQIDFSLGYSHQLEFKLPKGITAEVDNKQTKITLKGIDKQLIGQVAANIRGLRSPDSYKGKGIRYENEFIKLKPGKAASK